MCDGSSHVDAIPQAAPRARLAGARPADADLRARRAADRDRAGGTICSTAAACGALPHLQALVARFDETVNLAVHQGGEVVIIDAVESGRSIRRGAAIGERDDWFVSSLGKSILAHLDEGEVLRLLEARPQVRLTPHTLVDRQEILDELDRVRERGYALMPRRPSSASNASECRSAITRAGTRMPSA